MKNLKNLKIAGITMLLFTLFSCSLEPEIHSTVTNYPIMALKGEAVIYVEAGTPYADPGITATENGAPIPYTSTAVGTFRHGKTLDTNIADEYVQTYKATNKDGFSNTVTRKVVVWKNGDLVTSIEGIYLSTVTRNGSLLSPTQGSSVDMKYIYIWKNSDGTFEISDAFGGWYSIGRKIAGSATPGGIMKAISIPANTWTFPGNPMTNPYFGGPANLVSVTTNAVTKKVVVTCDWVAPGTPPTNYKFVSTLTQIKP